METERVLEEQRRYYRARAPEYDDWWFRRGRYDLGPQENARWLAECAEVERALAQFDPAGDVLELACGTGLWTRHLAPRAASLTAIDASAEVIELNRARLGGESVEYVQADIFAWRPKRHYDVCFFSFWLSHVPEERFDEFWSLVRTALRPGGRIFLVDSDRGDGAHAKPATSSDLEVRRLSDGREFEIVKRYFDPAELERRLAGLGWTVRVERTERRTLLYASGS